MQPFLKMSELAISKFSSKVASWKGTRRCSDPHVAGSMPSIVARRSDLLLILVCQLHWSLRKSVMFALSIEPDLSVWLLHE